MANNGEHGLRERERLCEVENNMEGHYHIYASLSNYFGEPRVLFNKFGYIK